MIHMMPVEQLFYTQNSIFNIQKKQKNWKHEMTLEVKIKSYLTKNTFMKPE